MRKIILYVVVFFVGFTSIAAGASCYSDRVVTRWIEERDELAVQVLQKWAKGASVDELTPAIATIISNELLTCSKCRNDVDFVKEKLILLNSTTEPRIETVPAIILKHYIGNDLLSPHRQFPYTPPKKSKGETKDDGTYF
ncbi:MAG: hypothetical protein HF978_06615 [Desulfobacteraceae bacterium]|nr:hypothetical protein [Desulfobacteraceae bacterium]MBC2755204.1 hypothetical protein [Desulfobacteraceae bacterium]